MSGIVLDTGALIALEKNDRVLWAVLKLAGLKNTDVVVPSTALTQVWRGAAAQARLSQALGFCVIAGFDAVARAVGELCGRTKTSDICDAHVAIIGARQGDLLYTTDTKDMRRLLDASGHRDRPKIIRC